MRLTINGETKDFDAPLTIAGLVAKLALPGNQVAVEVNKRLVRRCDHQATSLNPGDVIEVVTLVGGG